MDVLCRRCGNIQRWNPNYPYCSKCGSPVSEKDREVSIDLKAGKDKQALGIGLIALSIVIFHYFAKDEGSLIAGIGLLLWIWGKIINNREKKKVKDKGGNQ